MSFRETFTELARLQEHRCNGGMLVAQPLLQENYFGVNDFEKQKNVSMVIDEAHVIEDWKTEFRKGLWQARNTEDYYERRDYLASTHWDMLDESLPDNIPHVGHGRHETVIWD